MKKILSKFVGDESGAAIVEYGLALLVVGLVGIAGFNVMGNSTRANVDAACAATNTVNGTC